MFRISKLISYNFYKNRCILLDHAYGNDYELNLSAASILKKIELEHDDFSDEELEFIYDLIQAGIVVKDAGTEPIPSCGERTSIESVLWKEHTAYAAAQNIPLSAILELTYRCPVNCIHCYIDRNEVHQSEEISFDKYAEFINEFQSLGGLYIVLTGGDPFLHKDFEKIFTYARKKNIAVSVMSSGCFCDTSLLKKMSELGIMSFQVSIHGHNSEIHDRFTGVPGSFEKTLFTLKYLKKLGVFVHAAVIINRHNVEFFDDIIKMLEKEEISYSINFEMYPKRNGNTAPVKLNISEDEIIRCMLKTGDSGEPRLSGKTAEDYPCNAARSIVSLNPAGDIFPCLEMRIKAGNIKNGFQKIWDNSEIFREIRNIKFKDLKDCPECELKKFCNRCQGNSIREHLKIIEHSVLDCKYAAIISKIKMRKKIREKQIKDLQ